MRTEQTTGHLNMFYVPNVILASITSCSHLSAILLPYERNVFRFVDVVTRDSFKIGNIHVDIISCSTQKLCVLLIKLSAILFSPLIRKRTYYLSLFFCYTVMTLNYITIELKISVAPSQTNLRVSERIRKPGFGRW